MHHFRQSVDFVWGDQQTKRKADGDAKVDEQDGTQPADEVDELSGELEVTPAKKEKLSIDIEIEKMVNSTSLSIEQLEFLMNDENIKKTFYFSVKNTNERLVERVVEKKKELLFERIFEGKQNALLYSVQRKYFQLVRILLRADQVEKEILLSTGSEDDYSDIVNDAFEQLTQTDDLGYNALLHAVNNNDVYLVRQLIKICGGDEDLIKLQVQHGDESWTTPLMIASDKDSIEIVDILMRNWSVHKYQVTKTNKSGENALIIAARFGSARVIEKLLYTLGDLLSEMLSQKDAGGSNALMTAATFGNADAIGLLLQIPKDPSMQVTEKNDTGYTALMVAARYGNAACVRALLHAQKRKFADLQLIDVNKNGDNALIVAAESASLSVIEELLRYGLAREQLSHRDNQGFNALMISKVVKDQACTASILRHCWSSKILIPLFVESFAGLPRAKLDDTELGVVFQKLADAILVTRSVSVNDLAVNYLGDLIELAVEKQIKLTDVVKKFRALLFNSTDDPDKRKLLRDAEKTASSDVFNKYHASWFAKTYGVYFLDEAGKETADGLKKRKEHIASHLSSDSDRAKIERFHARHEPDNSETVQRIEARIAVK